MPKPSQAAYEVELESRVPAMRGHRLLLLVIIYDYRITIIVITIIKIKTMIHD